jgi:hypothetical protein
MLISSLIVDKPVHNYVDKLWISPVKLVDIPEKMWDMCGILWDILLSLYLIKRDDFLVKGKTFPTILLQSTQLQPNITHKNQACALLKIFATWDVFAL